ncbi:phytanoyl-CoA dioxygenase family protein [Pseudoluteimonas lycopersici]|uniref:Phytanoyl-CoA dioxygenase family protein n=1 Tax=Pseudoluteimonas lycopersici TaxID=1324796 RepID=A0A516V5D7_9GAMM|nr:phytanoyl-CoA dioxygenase family protein [Lysobacter lycopersici]QDQ73739.1 phytanoyl-CoA dioxygenase family protein [Lysobacter lycopersici]
MPREPELRTAHPAVFTTLDMDGYRVLPAFLRPDECERLASIAAGFANGRAGSRQLLRHAAISETAARIRALPQLAGLLPDDAIAVQCTLFAKTRDSNWSVTPHQDLGIPVDAYVESPECTGWSRKDSALFVQPPDSILDTLLAIRLQLDDHAADTGPLEVVPESHRLGRLKSADVAERASNRRIACIPQRGGAVALRPLTIHASSKATSPLPRRVLHILFGPRDLPLGLRWAAMA